MKLFLLLETISITLCLCEDNVVKEVVSRLGHVERLRHPVLRTPFTLANQDVEEKIKDPSGLTIKNIQVLSEEQPTVEMDKNE
jgi:hypothetical protein